METTEAMVEMPEATVETAEPESGEAVKAMVAVKNGHVAAKVNCSSEEWVTLATHNLEARCAPFAIEHSPFLLHLVVSAPHLHLQGGPASAPHTHPSYPCFFFFRSRRHVLHIE